jgi:hypothetical protein
MFLRAVQACVSVLCRRDLRIGHSFTPIVGGRRMKGQAAAGLEFGLRLGTQLIQARHDKTAAAGSATTDPDCVLCALTKHFGQGSESYRPSNGALEYALVLATFAERDAAVTERDTLLAQNDRLRHLLLKLTRMQSGAKSERLPEEQLQLGLEAPEQAIAKADAETEKRDPEQRQENAVKRRASRGALPAHLPRIEVTLTPEDTACPCCRAAMTVIGEDTSERLDVIPAQFRVIVTKRPKLACRNCPGTVVQTPAPPRLIEGGLPQGHSIQDLR